MAIIEYDDKTNKITPTDPDQQVTAEDLNEIKESVNAIYNGVSDTRIPVKEGGEFVDSALYYDAANNKLVSDIALEVPAGTIKVGETTDLSASTGNLIIEDRINETNKYIVGSIFDSTGTDTPKYLNLEAEYVLNIQTTSSETLTDNPLTFSLTGTVVAPMVRQLNTTTFKTGSILTNVRIKFTDNVSGEALRYIPDKAAWDAGENGITTVAGDNLFDFISTDADTTGVFNLGVSPLIIQENQVVDIEIQADAIDVLGESGGTPYLIADVQDGLFVGLSTDTVSNRIQKTGLLEGGVISVDTATTVDWTSGVGTIADYTDPENPIITDVTWDAVSAQAVTNIATDGSTIFGYDSSGSIVEALVTSTSISDSHSTIWFGSVFHLAGSIVSVSTAPANLGYDSGSFSDFLNLVIGPANIDGNVYDANGTNLNIDVVGGNAFIIASNFRTDKTLGDIITLPNDTALSYMPTWRTSGAGLSVEYGTLTANIDPDNYDDGSGTLATVTTDYWTIQRLYRARTGLTFQAYGQQEFATKELALSALGSESFTEKSPLSFLLFRCSLVIQQGATDLSNIAEAEFFAQSSFRTGGVQSTSASIPGVTSPGGVDTNMQYNNAGSFGGTSNITYSGTSLDFADNTNIKMGTDDDLSIDHNGINTIISNSTGEIFVDNTSPSGSIIFRLLGVFPATTRFDIRDSTSADIFSVLGSGAVQLQDNIPLRFGTGNDFTIIHNETDTLFVSNTGDMEFYNTDATGLIFFTLGTDTAATSFQVRDNSSVPLFEVFGDGTLSIGIDPTISINTEGNVDFKNSISTPYIGSGQLQNLLRWSENTTNAVWVDTPSVLAITADQALAPDGTMTADEWAFSAFVGTGVLQTVVLTNGATYTLSFWARALTTARVIRFDLGDGAFKDVNVKVTDDLQRYSVEIVAGNNDILYVKNHIATAGTIYVWGFQLNEGVERLPYAKTEATLINASGSEAGLFVNGDAIIDGYVGIGNSDPRAPLQFETSVANKKIVLWGTGDSDHEFFGFGVSGVSLRYQVNSTDSDHTFYAATGPSTSDELMRITGDGKVGIGITNPQASLHVAGDAIFDGALYPENVVGYIKNGETGFSERHISTGVFSATTIPLTATGIIYGAWWGKEGTRLYVTTADAYIYQYNLTVPYDITTATLTASNNFTDPNNSNGYTLWNDDGTVFYHGGRGYRAITLTTPWEISGIASDTGNFSLSFQDPLNMYDLRWNFDGTKVLGVGNSINQAQSQSFIEWECTTPYDLTTTTQQDANIYPFPTGVPDGSIIVIGFDISPDGTRVYLSAPSTGIEYEVVLETAWDLSSSVLVETVTRTSNTDIVNYSMAPDASGMVSVTPAGLIVQKKYGLEVGGNIIVDGGNVGIGTSTPNAPLEFSQGDAFRKIVLSGVDNNNEFYGFGVNSGRLLYQVNSITADHVFFAATSFGSSHELFRITGDGLVGIGNSNPQAPLHFEQVTASRKIVLWSGQSNDNQFYGFGVNGGSLRYQVDGVIADHVFYAGTSSTTSDELMRILGSGDVAIGTVGSGGRFTFTKSTDDSAINIYSGSATGSASHVFYNSTPAIAADIIYDETNNNFSISTEAGVDLILATGAGANIGVNKPLPVSTLHISEGTTTSDATTGTTFENIGLGSAVTHYVRALTGGVFSSGIDEDDVYKISNDYGLGINTDIAINTEANIDFKNTIATPYGGFGRLQNLILWSEDTANTTAWTAIALQVVVTGDQATAPDGTLTADEWAYTGTIGLALRNFSFSLAQGATYTVSFWARALTTDRVVRFDLGDGGAADITVLVTDDLQRYSAQLVAGASNWLDITNASAFASTIYVWGFQINEGSERLPYTRTEAVQVHGSGPESGLAINHSAIFSTIAAPNYSEGTLFYDDGDKALSYYNEDSNVTVGIGRDLLVRVQNDQGTTISSGEAVYINGSSGGLPTVKLARSDSSVTSQFAGIVTETLVLNGEIGYVSTFGLIEFLNTSAWSAGDELYLSSTVAGALTNVPPADPNHIVSVAHVVISDLITGSIQVHTPERIATNNDLNTNTGILEGGAMTVNGGDNTLIDVTAGTARICDYTDPLNPVHRVITWDAQTIDPTLDVDDIVWIGVQESITPGIGEIIFNTQFTQLEKRSIAVLGRVWGIVATGVILGIGQYTTPAFDQGNTAQDLSYAIGSFNKTGNVYSANGANLLLNRSAGESFRFGAGWGTNPTSPHVHTDALQTAISQYIYIISGSNVLDVQTDVDPDNYDLAGTKTAVPTGKFTLQRFYFFPVSQVLAISYGQELFDSMAQAIGAAGEDDITLDNEVIDGSILRGWVALKQGATDLSDSTQALFKTAQSLNEPNAIGTVGTALNTRSFSLADSGAADISYVGGFYESEAASSILTIGGTVTRVFGGANRADAAHAFVVASGAGGTNLVLTVSGTSITDTGVRTTSDTEIIVPDTDAAITNQYFETSKKWLGIVTFTLTGTSGSFTFNYGKAKYEDFGNRDFTVSDFEAVGKSNGNATGLDIKLYHHNDQNWTYSATTFVPGGTVICSLATDYSTDTETDDEQYFSYKRLGLSTIINGTALEGVLMTYEQATNNSVRYGTYHIGVLI